VQYPEAIKPRGIRITEIRAPSAITEHRAFTDVIDQHDDGAEATTAARHNIDALSAESLDQQIAIRFATDLADESGRSPGSRRAHRDVGCTATSSAQHYGCGVGRKIDGAAESHHDVFNKVADSSEHGADGTS
jgi:hypothetical protein